MSTQTFGSKVCPKCNMGHSSLAEYCFECGGKLETVPYLNCICGGPLFEFMKFCGKCGRKVE